MFALAHKIITDFKSSAYAGNGVGLDDKQTPLIIFCEGGRGAGSSTLTYVWRYGCQIIHKFGLPFTAADMPDIRELAAAIAIGRNVCQEDAGISC